jgi:hypothetical protein
MSWGLLRRRLSSLHGPMSPGPLHDLKWVIDANTIELHVAADIREI